VPGLAKPLRLAQRAIHRLSTAKEETCLTATFVRGVRPATAVRLVLSLTCSRSRTN